MINYEVEPATLVPFVPAGTMLDLWRGRAYVSVVGFRFLHTRVLGLSLPLHRDFDEVNLRFYVKRQGPGGEVRHGVTFIRELVPRALIAVVAKMVYNEPYRALAMRSSAPDALPLTSKRLIYEWKQRGAWEHVAATPCGDPAVPMPGSDSDFITNRPWGYTRQRDGGTIEYEVTHDRWRVWAASEASLHADVPRLYGEAFAPALREAPASALVADGSPVVVYRPTRIA